MAPITDRTTRTPSGVASPVTNNLAAEESVFVNLGNRSNFKIGPLTALARGGEMGGEDPPPPTEVPRL